MKNRKLKIGLALGSGSARGLAHIGVLKVLKKEGIPIDLIVGTSMGALVGGIYASGVSPEEIENIALGLDWKKLGGLIDFVIPVSGFINGLKIKELITTLIKKDKLENLEIPFLTISTDIKTGEEVIINQGSLVEAIRASISIPGIFSPVKYENRFLIDGGLSNPVPIDVAKKMGMDVVIAINVIAEPGVEKKEDKNIFSEKINDGFQFIQQNSLIKKIKDSKIKDILTKIFPNKNNVKFSNQSKDEKKELMPNIISVMAQTFKIAEEKIVKLSLKGQKDAIIIQPDVWNTNFFDFTNASQCILAGEEATILAMPEIKKRLKKA
ncbi:MAG: patatin-like phospholipase family protein [Spirochaetes bacterium]|nr:patatin-like phospholipase family protein [Spirochaetota bacterium]